MKISWNLENSKFGNSVATSKNYTVSKNRVKFQKRFPNMKEVKVICANFVLMDLINSFGVSGDVT